MSLRAAARDARDIPHLWQQDLQRTPSQPSLTYTTTTELSDDAARAQGPITPLPSQRELDATTADYYGSMPLPKGDAPGATLAAPATPSGGGSTGVASSIGRAARRVSRLRMPMPDSHDQELNNSQSSKEKRKSKRLTLSRSFQSIQAAATTQPSSQPQTPESKEKRKSKRLSLSRSLHDLRERRAQDKARKRNSTASEKYTAPSTMDQPPPPVPSIPSKYRDFSSPTELPYAQSNPFTSTMSHAVPAGAAPPTTPRKSSFSGFIRKLTGKKTKGESQISAPPVPPLPQPQFRPARPVTPPGRRPDYAPQSYPQPSTQASVAPRRGSRQFTPTQTSPSKRSSVQVSPSKRMSLQNFSPKRASEQIAALGRKETRFDNVPQVNAPKSVRGMLNEMAEGSVNAERRATLRRSQVRRVPVPQSGPDEREPIIDPHALPAPPEPQVEPVAAAEARADALARLIGKSAATSVDSHDSADSRRVRAPVPPRRTNSHRSKQSKQASPPSKPGSDVPVTPPPEAMDVFSAPPPVPCVSPGTAAEAADETTPMVQGEGRQNLADVIELKSVRRFSVSEMVTIDAEQPATTRPLLQPTTPKRQIVRPPPINVAATRAAPSKPSGVPARVAENSHFSDTSDEEFDTDTANTSRSTNASAVSPPAAIPFIQPQSSKRSSKRSSLVAITPGQWATFGVARPSQPAKAPESPTDFGAALPSQPPLLPESPTDVGASGPARPPQLPDSPTAAGNVAPRELEIPRRPSAAGSYVAPSRLESRNESRNEFYSAHGHGSVLGHGSAFGHNNLDSDTGHSTVLFHESEIGHSTPLASNSDTDHATVLGSRPDFGREPQSLLAYTRSRSDLGASHSDLGHSTSPALSAGHSEIGLAVSPGLSPGGSHSDLGHGMPGGAYSDLGHSQPAHHAMAAYLRADLGHGLPPRTTHSDVGHGSSSIRNVTQSEDGHGFRQASASDLGHGGSDRSKHAYADARSASAPQGSRQKVPRPQRSSTFSSGLTNIAIGPTSAPSSWANSGRAQAMFRVPRKQASYGDIAAEAGRRPVVRKASYDDIARSRTPTSSHGHGSANGHDSEDFHSALEHSSVYNGGSSIGHSSWLHEDPARTPRTPYTPRSPRDPRLAGSSPAREAPVGEGRFDPSDKPSRLRSLSRKISSRAKPVQPPTSYDAYAEKQAQLLTRRKSCKPIIHSEASLAAEIHSVKDKEEGRLMEACFMS